METKLYFASVRPLADEAMFERLLRTVRPARREKVLTLKHAPSRRLSLGAGLLLETALREEGLSAGEVRATEYGKPYFPDLPGFHFSLSHSGEGVLCAVSPSPVGCDLEAPRPYDPRLAARFFHPDENAWLLSLPEKERPDAFLRLWTCKESFIKALGLGLALPLGDFAVVMGEKPTLRQEADARPWHLRSFREGEYICALCGLEGVEDAQVLRVDLRAEVNP